MSEPSLAPIRTWLAAPMKHDVSEAIERLRRAPDVQQIAVMPDVHLAADVCIGVVVATSQLIYPQAVGGDIGCGMLAVGFDVGSDRARTNPAIAGRVLADSAAPCRRGAATAARRLRLRRSSNWRRSATRPGGDAPQRRRDRVRDARQRQPLHRAPGDEEGRLWLMVHSGSRGMGPGDPRPPSGARRGPSAAGCARWTPAATQGASISTMPPGRAASPTQAGGRWRWKWAT